MTDKCINITTYSFRSSLCLQLLDGLTKTLVTAAMAFLTLTSTIPHYLGPEHCIKTLTSPSNVLTIQTFVGLTEGVLRWSYLCPSAVALVCFPDLISHCYYTFLPHHRAHWSLYHKHDNGNTTSLSLLFHNWDSLLIAHPLLILVSRWGLRNPSCINLIPFSLNPASGWRTACGADMNLSFLDLSFSATFTDTSTSLTLELFSMGEGS